ncbi:MAG: homocysteine S-methyltransferase family protein, partial [Proteobacteria bacterium]|nr:homocysteine S-methyltransferase family protein [Pseudomonadota bacterium]
MSRDFLKELSKRPLVFDGGMGTMLQKLGLKAGGCPDELNITNPEIVYKVHAAYKEAGSDIVTTNTFGANRIKLEEYSLESKLAEINIAAVKNARKAVGEDGFVAGDIGPIGRFIEPVGDLSFDEAIEIFTEQARALKEGGADLFIIETMMDLKEIKAAIIAAKSCGLPVVATMTFDQSMKTMLGTSPEVFAITADALGADVIGANCSLGIDGIFSAIAAMSNVTNRPLIAQANAGLPELKEDNTTVFPDSPDFMAERVEGLANAGVRVLGGCCGTTSDHIKIMAKVFKAIKPASRGERPFTALASRGSFTLFGGAMSPIIIGERINPTGRKKFAAQIKEGKTTMIREEARSQMEAGAHTLDVNVGVPDIDEPLAMMRAVFSVNENSKLPIVVDSPNIKAIEEGLKAVDGRALVNSVSGEEKKLDTILPLVKKYGAAVIGLALDDEGIPETAEARLKVAEKILERALKVGLRKEDIVIDCLAMTVSAMPD